MDKNYYYCKISNYVTMYVLSINYYYYYYNPCMSLGLWFYDTSMPFTYLAASVLAEFANIDTPLFRQMVPHVRPNSFLSHPR